MKIKFEQLESLINFLSDERIKKESLDEGYLCVDMFEYSLLIDKKGLKTNEIYAKNVYGFIEKFLKENGVETPTTDDIRKFILLLNDTDKVEDYGGEGQGDNIGFTVYFKSFGIYVNAYGYYDSWNGTDWEGIREVFPNVSYEIKYTIHKQFESIEEMIEEIQKLYNSIK